MLKNNLDLIIKELNENILLTKDELYSKCINDKLKQTVWNYDNSLDLSTAALLWYNQEKILKTITKIHKSEDKKALEAVIKSKKEKEKTNND